MVAVRNILSLIFTAFFLLIQLQYCKPSPKKNHYDSKKKYSRIVADNIFTAEVLYKLGPIARQNIIAVPAISDDKRYSRFTNVWPASVHRIFQAGEEVIALKPDLVITATFHSNDLRNMLQRFDIDYVFLEHFTGFSAYRKNVMTIAEITGTQEEGREMVKAFNRRLKAIEKNAVQLKARNLQAISYMHGNVMGSNSTFDDIVRAAGLQNSAAQHGIERYGKVSLEQILTWKPDVMIISCGQAGCENAIRNFKTLPVIRELNPVVVAIDSNILTSTNERMLDASEKIQQTLLKRP